MYEMRMTREEIIDALERMESDAVVTFGGCRALGEAVKLLTNDMALKPKRMVLTIERSDGTVFAEFPFNPQQGQMVWSPPTPESYPQPPWLIRVK